MMNLIDISDIEHLDSLVTQASYYTIHLTIVFMTVLAFIYHKKKRDTKGAVVLQGAIALTFASFIEIFVVSNIVSNITTLEAVMRLQPVIQLMILARIIGYLLVFLGLFAIVIGKDVERPRLSETSDTVS